MARENVKAEVKQNGKGEMAAEAKAKSEAEGIERERASVKVGARTKDDTIKKVEGERDESKIRVNTERTRVSTKTMAKTEALDIEKTRADAKAK